MARSCSSCQTLTGGFGDHLWTQGIRLLTKCFGEVKCLEVTFQQRAFWCPCCLLRVHDYPPHSGSWRLGGRQGSKGAEGEGEDRREYVKDYLSKLGRRTPIALFFCCIWNEGQASTAGKDCNTMSPEFEQSWLLFPSRKYTLHLSN